MIVTTIKGFTNVLGEPKGWDREANGEVFGLPVKIESHGDTVSATSAWKPTPDELAALLVGAAIHLRIIGGQPPVSVYVDGLPENLEPDFSESDARRALLLAKVVRLCAAQFESYAAIHAAKGTDEGAEKAATNQRIADLCAEALRGVEPPEPPEPPAPSDSGYVDAFYDLARMMDIGARAKSPSEVWHTEMRPKLAALLGSASVVDGLDRVCVVDERLNDSEGRLVGQPEECSALASRSLLDSELAEGDVDDRSTGGAVDLREDIVEIGSRHEAMVSHGTESRLTRSVEGSYQDRVGPWLLACFGEEIAADREERNHRFLEEALELVQANGCTASEAHQLVDYVFGRPVGEPVQEVGGVMVTLAALCRAIGIDMHAAGEIELARIWTKVDAIRAKQAAKPKHSPLPETAAATVRPSDDDLDAHLPDSVRAEKRCGIRRSAWLDGWYVPWSPRNGNENAEGPWSHWVELASAIIAADQKAQVALAQAGGLAA